MEKEKLKYLLTLPPEEIIKWYLNKEYRFSWNWQELLRDVHSRAFTVAKVMKLDVLQDIKNEVDKIFSLGETYETFQKNLESILKKYGWWGKVKASDVPGYKPAPGIDPDKIVQLGSPARLRTIFQTNSNVAYNAGRYKFQILNAEQRPYWQYKQLERKNKRKIHALYADKVFLFSDPIWDKIYPPNGWGCGCYVIALTEAEIKSRGLKVWKGSEVRIDVGEGWDYNPGKEAFKPDLNSYDISIRNLWTGK